MVFLWDARLGEEDDGLGVFKWGRIGEEKLEVEKVWIVVEGSRSRVLRVLGNILFV